ncbi:MAG: glycosyltransferase [Crocinitomicaceae bacterium]|nr:hypothetical protein [Flavobacteriales bacterium]NQZ37287.1 glycosyltransferase [Crocinitomicaceae bacterium]
MIRKLRADLKFRKDDPTFRDNVKSQLTELRKSHSVFTLLAQNTGYSWQGVKSAGISLFPDSWIELPQYYSTSLLSEESQIAIGEHIGELKFDQLIFNGFAPYFYTISVAAKKVNPKLKVKVVYHGFLAELSKNEFQQRAIKQMIDGRISGVIDTLGFAKKGLALTMNKLYNLNCKEIIYFNPPSQEQKPFDDNLNIGALVSDTFRKNFHNMATAGFMCDNSRLHVSNAKDLEYLGDSSRIHAHGFIEHADFIKLLGQMTVNLHATFSEASGGQVCSESISQGVPCISSYTSAFFDYDDELKDRLVVQGVDDSWHIYQKIQEVLNDRDYLSKRCIEYSAHLNILAKDRMDSFLGA